MLPSGSNKLNTCKGVPVPNPVKLFVPSKIVMVSQARHPALPLPLPVLLMGPPVSVTVDKILEGAKSTDLPCRAIHQVRAGHQPEDREGARADHPAVAAGAGGRGDPI